MKNKLLTAFLVISVIFAMLFVNADKLVNPKYSALLLESWGDNPFPELLGDYTFGEEFSESLKSLGYLVSYPFRVVYWIGQQMYTFFSWSNGGSWVGSGAGPGGGSNSGVIQGGNA